jgi:hypothetical protein
MHPHQEEHWSVVEGRVEFKLDGTKRVIGPEDGTIVVGRNRKHALAAVDEVDAHLRCLATPALDLEEFLTDSAAAAREGLFIRGGIPRNLRGARWAAGFLARHRDNVVMSFPPQFAQRAMVALLGGGSGRTKARQAPARPSGVGRKTPP